MNGNPCFHKYNGLCFWVNFGTGIKPVMIEYFPDTNPVERLIIQDNAIFGFTSQPEIIDFDGDLCFSLS